MARVSNTVVVLAAPASLKAQSLKEVMQMVKEEPGKLNYASVTQVYDIMMAAYLKGAGLDMARITYKDAVSAQNDLVEGRIQLYSAAYAIVRGHVQGGRMRLLAVQNRTRAPGLDVPTAAEAGFPGAHARRPGRPDGGALERHLSDAVRERIAADVKTHLSDPALNERMTATGQIVNPGLAGGVRRGDRRAVEEPRGLVESDRRQAEVGTALARASFQQETGQAASARTRDSARATAGSCRTARPPATRRRRRLGARFGIPMTRSAPTVWCRIPRRDWAAAWTRPRKPRLKKPKP